MEFGPEIKVDGVRPEWLSGGEPLIISWSSQLGGGKSHPGSWTPDLLDRNSLGSGGWLDVVAIQLPFHHACYSSKQRADHASTPTPDERAVAPELVERMRKLVERMALADKQEVATMGTGQAEAYTEARAIVAALEPVDPDKEIVRQMRLEWAKGDEDVDLMLLRVLKRGRQLEKEGK